MKIRQFAIVTSTSHCRPGLRRTCTFNGFFAATDGYTGLTLRIGGSYHEQRFQRRSRFAGRYRDVGPRQILNGRPGRPIKFRRRCAPSGSFLTSCLSIMAMTLSNSATARGDQPS